MRQHFFTGIGFGLVLLMQFLFACTDAPKGNESEVQIVGAMRNTMWKGEIAGIIHLDTLRDKENLYGLGPVENLSGELVILNGKSYKSEVRTDSTMRVTETFDVKAPFFSYARIEKWIENELPDSIQTIVQLEKYLGTVVQDRKQPLFFKIEGRVKNAYVHVVNLPKGSTVSSPTEAHRGQVNYRIENQSVEILGFYSTRHKAIFTHHNTNVHMHLITQDLQRMGHVDKLSLIGGTAVLYLPAL